MKSTSLFMRRGEKEPSEKERGERKIKRYAALQPKEREREREFQLSPSTTISHSI